MTENINYSLLTELIKGLEYDSLADEFTFSNKTYRLRTVKPSGKKIQESHLYFTNTKEPTDIKLVKTVSGIPSYDGFNETRIDSKLRKLVYCREYYKNVTINKRREISEKNKAEREKLKEIKKEQKAKEKEKLKLKKLAEIKPIKCAFCGNEFKPKTKKQIFCCHSCQLKYNSKKQAEKIKKENRLEKICPICNKKFVGTPKEIYCSKDCYKISQKENRRQRYERDKASGAYNIGGKYYSGSNNI